MTCIQEEWKPVVGYEGLYAVSSAGKVMRVLTSRGAQAGKVLRVHISPRGYCQISLRKDMVRRVHYVHRLVAEAFIGEAQDRHEVNHIDACKTNNRADNLEYVTTQGNAAHAALRRLYRYGEQHHAAKVNEPMVREIRRLYKTMGCDSIAPLVGVSRSTVWLIATRKAWKHVS